MRTLFNNGIVHPRDSAWMGQLGQSVYATTTPTATTTKETNWWDALAIGIEQGGKAYGTYGQMEIADEQADVKRVEAEAAASALRTAKIMQETLAMQQQATTKQGQIMGIDKTAFFVGASLLGLGVLGGVFYLLGNK